MSAQLETQAFFEPTPGDAAKDGGLRYQSPTVDAAIALGFDLAEADQNPFTAFRFPDVPAGADNRFALTLGGTEIIGLAGETVNLRQYAQNGFTALSLRGDLSPFLPAAAAPDVAIPIGGPPPQLTFGLAFARPGIGSFTLKPVPEPASCLLGAVGAVVVFLCWRSRSLRLLAIAASCLLVGSPLPAATINMSVFLDASGVVDPRGPGRQDDLPIVTASAAMGVGVFELDTTTNVLSYEILFTDQLLAGLEIGADLRAPDSTADILFPLPLGHYTAGVTRRLAPSEVASLAAGAWAVSIRTEAYPAGEIGSYIGTAPEPAGICLALTAIVVLAVYSRRKQGWQTLLLLVALTPAAARADILRWDNAQVIPGTEGITPGPGVDLSDWNTDTYNLKYADLAGLNLPGASFSNTWLDYARIQGADLTNANLRSSSLRHANLTDANLTGALVTGTDFSVTNLTAAQLYSTQSYAAKDLPIGLGFNDLTGWDFHEQNLAHSAFYSSTLTSANMTRANLAGAAMYHSTLRNATLSGANLTNASLAGSDVTGANLSGAVVVGADLGVAYDGQGMGGLTKEQLYSTQSYQDKTLNGIHLAWDNLSEWDFTGQDLSNANLIQCVLTDANLTGAVVAGTMFYNTTSRGFTQQQLSSTQSYKDKNLAGIDLGGNDLTGWDFHEQNLANADFSYSKLAGANLTGADTRGAAYSNLSGVILKNTILPHGLLNGLNLQAGEMLVVRDDDGVPEPPTRWPPRSPIPVTVQHHLTMAAGGVLELRFDADPWDSLISFQAGIPVNLGGTLDLTFVKDADPASQVGHTLHLFNWTGVSPTGAFTVSSLYDWDLSNLYTTGEVTLLAAGGVIAGDSNGDGKVDLGDFGTLKDHFGAAGSRAEGDSNDDGKVDLADFGLLKANFGKSAAAVPEPATVVLAMLGLAPLLLAQRIRGAPPVPLIESR